VCKSHINKELTISENQLKCVFCPEKVKHTVPEEGYVVNKRIKSKISKHNKIIEYFLNHGVTEVFARAQFFKKNLDWFYITKSFFFTKFFF